MCTFVEELSNCYEYFLRLSEFPDFTAQKMKFSIKYFFSKYDQIRRKLRIWSHLLRKSLMENFIFFAVFIWQSSLISFVIMQLDYIGYKDNNFSAEIYFSPTEVLKGKKRNWH